MSNALDNIDQANELVEKGDQNDLWPQDLSSQQKKQVAYIASQYGLDPFFGELQVLGGNPYVTREGLIRTAHEDDNPPVSIQVEPTKSNGERHFEYKALLWKQDTPENRPYVEYGEASPQDCNSMISKCDKDLKAMARTRAINRVIRLAYKISLTSAEEVGPVETNGSPRGNGSAKDVTPTEPLASSESLERISDLSDKLGWSEKALSRHLKEKTGISLAELTEQQADKTIKWLESKVENLEPEPDPEPEPEEEEQGEEPVEAEEELPF